LALNEPLLTQGGFMKITRRIFFTHAALAVGGVASMPQVSTNTFIIDRKGELSIHEVAELFFTRYNNKSSFIAQANVLVGAATVLGVAASIIKILEYFDVRPNFSNRPSYAEASQCREQLQRQERHMRIQHNLEVFTNVERSPLNHDIAILAGRTERNSNRAEIAVQYQANAALNYEGIEPDLARIAANYIRNNQRLNDQDFAKSIAITGKSYSSIATGQTAVLQNALGGGIIYDPTPFRYGNQIFDRGRVGIYIPRRTNPNYLPEIGLHS